MSISRLKLIVHIGASKTGTSAIQTFLAKNKDTLRNSGILVPDVNLDMVGEVEGHQVWFFESKKDDLPKGKAVLEALIARVRAEAYFHTIIISAENLSNPNGCARIFEGLNDVDVDVCLYIRRQDDYLISAWQQWFCKVYPDFWTWVIPELGRTANWKRCIEDWERVAVGGKVKVRRYSRAHLDGGDVVEDFASLIGLVGIESLKLDERSQVNISLSEVVTQLGRLSKGAFSDAHDNQFFEAVLDLTGRSYVRPTGESELSVHQRVAIIDAYRDSNQWVRNKYFPDSTGDLFSYPGQEEVKQIVGGDAEVAKQIGLLTDMVFELYKRVNSSGLR